MQDVPIKILGISATPIAGGNCDTVMREALKTASSFGHVETEMISLAEKDIQTCIHCQWCIENRQPCKYEDDGTEILKKMMSSDGMIWGAPVWSHTISPHMAQLMSKARYYCFFTGGLRNKVLGAYVVSWFGVGEEMALMTLEALAHNYLMIPVFRAWARVSKIAVGQRPEYSENGALDDPPGMVRLATMAKRVVEVTRMIKFADQAGVGIPESETRSITCGRYPLWHKKTQGL
jgi:multimeric flavodoxin WrbA